MGIAIPQVITSDRASGAQVIDGSLKIDSSSASHLERTPGSAGNRKTFSFSGWIKKYQGTSSTDQSIIVARTDSPSADGDVFGCRFEDDGRISVYDMGNFYARSGVGRQRDTTGWIHVFFSVDTTVASNNVKLYVNNVLVDQGTHAQNTDTRFNSTNTHRIGRREEGSDLFQLNAAISNYYVIDGQALEPTDFGFTDPLTNTWKPKKYTGTFGTNGFWLPMDGNFPIGQDKSGNGNDWTPQGFGGSVALDSPQVSGARPILNTTPGGTQAGVGVFGSKQNVGYAVTVYDDGGGNKYYIDGVKQATLTGLIRGATYTFDTSDSTIGSTHPFRLSATSAHGTEYTNGVAAITGAATTITIPYDAPESLYYYCTSHSGMGSSITGITTNEKLADQYASHCTLALPLLGSDDDVCASIACTANNKTPTNSSVTASTTQSNFYGGSHHWSANSDTLQYAEQGDELVLGTGDFTIEFWYFDDGGHSGTGGRTYLFDNRIGGSVTGDPPTLAGWLDGTEVNLYITGGGGTISYVGSAENKWHHYAAVRSGSTVTLYHDGVARGTMTSSTNFTNNGIGVGRATDANYGMAGYIQDFRIYKGVAKYTSDFVIPATKPDILPDTPSGVSGGSKLTKITDGAVSFDGTGDYLKLANTTDVNFGSGDFTWECFAYFHTVTGSISLMGQWENSTNRRSWLLQLNDGKMQSYLSSSGNSGGDAKQADSPANYMAANRWYHIAVTRSSNDMNLFIDGELITTTDLTGFTVYSNTDDAFSIGSQKSSASNVMNGYISNARIIKGTALYTSRFTPPAAPLTNVTNTKLLCCQSNSEGPQKTAVIPSATGTATAMWTLDSDINDDSGNDNTLTENGGSTSFVSAGTNPFGLSNCADFAADGKYLSYAVTPASAWTIDGYIKFDDVSSGSNSYVLGWNGTNGNDTTIGLTKSNSTFTVWGSSNLSTTTVAETGRWYHVRLTTNSTSDLALYVDGVLAGRSTSSDGSPASPITIGDMQSGRFNGQIAGVRYVTTDLGAPPLGGETTSSGVTSNSPSVGVSLSGDVAATNFNPFNTDIKTVRGQETGYCTLNPLWKNSNTSNSGGTFADGNLNHTTAGSNGNTPTCANIYASSGKFYWEVTLTSGSAFGIGVASDIFSSADYPGYGTGAANGQVSWGYNQNGVKIHNATSTSSYGSSYTVGDTIGVAMNLDTGELEYYKNGVSQGVAFTDLEGNLTACHADTGSAAGFNYNFGQKPFKFAPPDGFQPLTTANTRPVKVISRPDQYVGVTTWSGNGVSQNIIGLKHKPDFVWIKKRAGGTARSNQLFDSIRGVHETLHSDGTDAQDTNSNRLTAFNQDGFAVGGDDGCNGSSGTFVGWTWKAGGNKNTFNVDDVGYASAAAAGLTAGDTTVTGASVGTKQGFSIIKYTGPNDTSNHEVPHGLSQAPDFIITKNLDDTYNWDIYHSSLADDAYLIFTNAATRAQGFNGRPTSTVFKTEHDYSTDENDDYIAYCWHDVPGLQKFGTYEANGSTDGPYVELGFTPAILMLKNYDDTEHWYVYDPERSPHNVAYQSLLWSNNGAENTGTSDTRVDLLSNGFKLRQSNGPNTSGDGYIYAAWAAAPTIDLFGGGANAR